MIYENWFGSLFIINGWILACVFNRGLYEDRLPIDNTTDYSFFWQGNGYPSPNYPFEIEIVSSPVRH
jgi:hypothetical protein